MARQEADPRPDLVAYLRELDRGKAPNYIGHLVAPNFGRAFKTGSIYFHGVESDGSAQTGRTVGTGPTNNMLTPEKTTFDLDSKELIYRGSYGRSDIQQTGGLDPAHKKLARKGYRAVEDAKEALVATAILGTVTPVDIGSSLIKAVDAAKWSTRDSVLGITALVCSATIRDRIARYAEIEGRMVNTGVPMDTLEEVRNIGNRQIAAILGVDVVIVGPDNIWYNASASYQNHAAIVSLPFNYQTGDVSDPDEEIQTVRTITLELDGEEDLLVESFYDLVNKRETVDTQIWAEVKTFNPEGIYVLSGIYEGGPDADNSSSSSSSS